MLNESTSRFRSLRRDGLRRAFRREASATIGSRFGDDDDGEEVVRGKDAKIAKGCVPWLTAWNLADMISQGFSPKQGVETRRTCYALTRGGWMVAVVSGMG